MPATVPVRVWDLPTRLFHWVLALAVAGSVISAKVGGAAMVWHFRLGYLVFFLLLFRLAWGVLGGRWSRFSSFLYGPGAVRRYLRGQPREGERFGIGHNPLGALSVFALLTVLVVQVATGLVGDDEIASVGPLNRFVATATGLAATAWHKNWGQWLLLALVALHLGAIAFHAWRRDNLVGPMLHGDKPLPAHVPASADDVSARLRALAVAAVCALAVWWVVRLGG
jgi:cytochrome b